MNKKLGIKIWLLVIGSFFLFSILYPFLSLAQERQKIGEIRIELPAPPKVLIRELPGEPPIVRLVNIFRSRLALCPGPEAPPADKPQPKCDLTLDPKDTDATAGRYNGKAVCDGYNKNLDCILIGRAESPLGIDKEFVTFGGITSVYNFKGTVKEGGKHTWTIYNPFGKECVSQAATRSSLCSLTAKPMVVDGEGKYDLSAVCTGVNAPCRLDTPAVAAGQFSGSRDFKRQIPPDDPVGRRGHELFSKSDNYEEACDSIIVSRVGAAPAVPPAAVAPSSGSCALGVSGVIDNSYMVTAQCTGAAQPCSLDISGTEQVKAFRGIHKQRYQFVNPSGDQVVVEGTPFGGEAVKCEQSVSPAIIATERIIPAECSFRAVSNPTGQDGFFKTFVTCLNGSIDTVSPCELVLYDNSASRSVSQQFQNNGEYAYTISKGPVTVTLANKDHSVCKEEIVHKPKAGQTTQVPCPSISVLTTSLPDGTVNTAYSKSLDNSSTTQPYSWSLSSGSLPSSLSISSGGTISGTPDISGLSSFTVQVTDSCSTSRSDTQDLSINISGY